MIALPKPNENKYSIPVTSLFAYFNGVMNEPFAIPTYVAHNNPILKSCCSFDNVVDCECVDFEFLNLPPMIVLLLLLLLIDAVVVVVPIINRSLACMNSLSVLLLLFVSTS
jgi:hypothetical protein